MFNFFKNNPMLKLLPKVKGKYLNNVNLSKHTWFGVGGPAEVMYIPADENDLSYFLKNCPKNIPTFVIGGGSNLLVRDGGIPGVVIKLDSPAFKKVDIKDNQITCGAGLKNIELKKHLISNELGGLEFLCSIPGVIGGSVKTNAGCFGKEVKDVISSAQIINGNGEIKTIDVKDLELDYRTSCFPEDWIILSITFNAVKESKENIEKTLAEHKAYRQANQPYNQKTAGSTFKNPKGLRAWELIKKSGCDSLVVGGAKVSDKHCNFLINTGNATAKDIETLGENIISQVRQKTYITLEWEVKRVGIDK
ncbi:MAG: UDP-N-acetylmuramate dehydrogenase [Alphaproteobacteria bacterium]|nr:UDP-N-acetylmuramate dehydrogenase [Alphaproteobacteria bacterium]